MKGKNKEQFEKWYFNYLNTNEFGKLIGIPYTSNKQDDLRAFLEMKFEFQIGVYLAYYDSLGIKIFTPYNGIQDFEAPPHFFYVIITDDKNLFNHHDTTDYDSRNEAYKEAFKRADEIVNKQLNS